MIFNRHCIALLIAGCCCTHVPAAEDTPAATGSGGASPAATSPAPGASSSFGSSVFSAGTSGSGTGGTAPFGLGGGTASGAGAASAFSKPSSTSDATTFTLPGFYGQGQKVLTSGEGILAKPRYETTFSLSMGYDDNYLSAPGGGAPTLVFNGAVETIAGVKPGTPIYEDHIVFISGVKRLEKVLVGFSTGKPGQIIPIFDTLPPASRDGSFLTKASFGFNMQMATRRSLFTLAASGGTTYYWAKDKDPFENDAHIGANFLYKLTPRFQVTAGLSANYTQQPDFSQLNIPNHPTSGPYFDVDSRADMTYRFTPRFSMTGSLTYSMLRFSDSAEQIGDHDEYIGGITASYLWNPRFTFLVEYRHSMTSYSTALTRDSATDFFLIGAEFRYSSRLEGSLRVGETIRHFDLGGSASAPYVESTLSYRATSRSVLSWTNRFGFEEPNGPDQERLVLRSGINYSYTFTPRLRGTLSVNLLHERDKVLNSDSTGTVQLTYDSTATLNYAVNQHFNLNLSYSLTDVASDQENSSFYRNRIFLGGDYNF